MKIKTGLGVGMEVKAGFWSFEAGMLVFEGLGLDYAKRFAGRLQTFQKK